MTLSEFKTNVKKMYEMFLMSPIHDANKRSEYDQTETELDYIEWLKMEAFGLVCKQMKKNNQTKNRQSENDSDLCLSEANRGW